VHPHDHGVAVLSLIIGALMVVVSFSDVIVSPLFEAMPWWVVLWAGVLFVTGGVLVVRGLHWDKDDRVSVGWRVEQGGWALISGALVAFAIGAGYVGASATGVIIPWVLGVSSAIRWLSFRYIRRNAQVRPPNERGAHG